MNRNNSGKKLFSGEVYGVQMPGISVLYIGEACSTGDALGRPYVRFKDKSAGSRTKSFSFFDIAVDCGSPQ
jgi:hypothetical protein